MHRFTVISVCLLLAVGSSALCAEPYVTATYQPSSSGFLLQFVLHNSLSDETLTRWHVTTLDASSPVAPSGWDVGLNYREVHWSALQPSSYVQPGAQQGGFSYASQGVPGELTWYIAGSSWGYVGKVTPSAVPEPSSLLALSGGLIALGGLVRRKRR